ncbi:hypothetical protein ACFWB2_33390 [Streptomyces virginiae]|uniref:hypothetical protein n=1 Tax=Streptomyces virginiae TaxID=1961 RepID=UPI0036B46833
MLSTGLRQKLTAHNLTGHRVHQLGPALLTVTVTEALDTRPAPAAPSLRRRRRGLGYSWKGTDVGL